MILSTVIVAIISVLSNAGFAGGLWAFLRKHRAEVLSGLEGIAASAGQIHITSVKHAEQQAEQLASHVKGIEEKIFTESQLGKKLFEDSLAKHTDLLGTTVNTVTAHAKQVIDARGQNTNASVERAICPSCQRTVYKFQKRADGTILRCDDCAARLK